MNARLSARIPEFCARLRRDHGFRLGAREVHDAVRALEFVGLADRNGVTAALRAVCCSRFEELSLFDRAFAAFFGAATLGVRQPPHAHPRRRTLVGTNDDASSVPARSQGTPAAPLPQTSEMTFVPTAAHPISLDVANAWAARRAAYSPMSGASESVTIPTEGLDAAIAQARRIVRRLCRVASNRWQPKRGGARFDLRRTLRTSLRTGGEIIVPRTLGHRLYNPAFVVLIDGSRSMAEHGARALQFAHALCRSTRRANVFLFSTGLRDVTRFLREAGRRGSYRLEGLGEAWGGGTRIGANLAQCVRTYAPRLNERTFAIVISDGLDVGETAALKWAMHEISRRCAAVAWLNPLADRSEYVPSAHGMKTALPYLDLLASLDDVESLATIKSRRQVAHA